MKLERRFKLLLFWTSAILYATGLAAWALASRFQRDQGYGLEPSPLRPWALHAHSVAGLVFIGLFGYLCHAHIEPGLKKHKRRRSGLALLASLAVLFLTVPLLFYLGDQTARAQAAWLHTWLGAILLMPFLLHLRE